MKSGGSSNHRPSSPGLGNVMPANPYFRPTSPNGTMRSARPTSPSNSGPGNPRLTNSYTRSASPGPTDPSNRSISPIITTNFFNFPPHPKSGSSNDAKSLHQSKVSRSQQCAVCMESYEDPRILPCFHSFCLGCLGSSCVQKGGGENSADIVYCPVCMEVSELGSRGVKGLPKNLYIQHLQELQQQQPPSSSSSTFPQLKCDLCLGQKDAVAFCEKCRTNLCEFCSEAHQKQRKTSFHCLVALEGSPDNVTTTSTTSSHNLGGGGGSGDGGSLPRIWRGRGRRGSIFFCEQHSSQELALSCEDCSLPVCVQCTLMEEHRGHSFVPLDEDSAKYSEVLQNLLARAKPLATSLKESLRNIDFVMSNIQLRSEVVSEEIIEFIALQMQALQEHKKSLLLQLDAVKKQKEGTLKVQMANLQTSLQELSSSYNATSSVLIRGTPSAAFTGKTPAVSKLEELVQSYSNQVLAAPEEDDYICFHRDIPADERNGFHMFGVLDSRGPSAANTTAEGEGLRTACVGKTAQFQVVVYDRHKQRREMGGDKIEVNIASASKGEIHAFIKEVEDGSYSIFYTPDTTGEHRISVLVEGKNVRGSPFVVQVDPRRSQHHGTFHCCTFCSSRGKKHIRCGCGGVMPGGYSGCGHGHPGHPGRHHWSCCGSTVEKSECLL